MNKAELVESIAEMTGLTKKDSEKAVAAFIETVISTLAKGEKVQLVGFGTFETRVHKERTNINPITKKEQVIPETTVPAFKLLSHIVYVSMEIKNLHGNIFLKKEME